MIGRSETLIKWLLYGAATVLVLFFQGALQNLRILGVLPFLYPTLAAVLSMYEGAFTGTVYSLVLGVVCDLALPGPIPCLYTLIFPLAGLCAGLIARSWLPAGFLCALVVSAAAFVLTDGFHCLLLMLSGKGAAGAAWSIALRETCVTLLFMPLPWFLFRLIHRKCHLDD